RCGRVESHDEFCLATEAAPQGRHLGSGRPGPRALSLERLPGSFRDPRGFVYEQRGTIYRQVNQSYAADYDAIVEAGLFDALTRADLLIPHQEVAKHDPAAYRTLKPDRVDFISYPYE